MNNTEGKMSFSRIGIAFFTGAIAYYLLVSILAATISKVNPGLLAGDGSMILSYAVLLAIGYPLVFALLKQVPAVELPKKKLGFGMALVAFMVSYLVMIVCNVLGLLINAQIGKLTGKGIMNPITSVVGDMSIAAQLIIVVIIAPIAEEFFFRKLIVDRVYKYGELLAALTSGLMFGLFHGNFQQFCYAFGIGVFFSFIYIRTGRIIYTMIFHMCINFLGSMPAALFMKGIDIELVQQYLFSGQTEEYMAYVTTHATQFAAIALYGLFIICFIVAAFILALIFQKRFRFKKHEGDLTGAQAFTTMFGNTGMMIFVLWWVANIVLNQFGLRFTELIAKLIG